MLRFAFALVVTLAVGVAVGLLAAPAPRPEAVGPVASEVHSPRRATDHAAPTSVEPETSRGFARREALPEREPLTLETGDEGPFSSSLLRLADEGIRLGWTRRRVDTLPEDLHAEGMRRFEQAVLALPERIGVELADEQTAREKALADAAAGGAFAFLASLAEGATPVQELATDAQAVEALFPRTTTGPTFHSGHPGSGGGKLTDALEDGATISFPAGVFELRRFLSLKTPFPSDVTLTGAGMDRTLLVLGSSWTARGPVRRLEVRDCTIFTADNYLIDQRQGEMTMLLQRVRVVGTDFGAGAMCVFSFGDGAVVLARDCRFEGGYGRDPGYGQLFSFRSDAPVAARLERCMVSRLHLTIEGIRGGTTLVFDACRLDQMLTFYEQSQLFDDPPPGLVLASGTTVTLHDREDGEVPKLDLNDLFPDWKERMERVVE